MSNTLSFIEQDVLDSLDAGQDLPAVAENTGLTMPVLWFYLDALVARGYTDLQPLKQTCARMAGLDESVVVHTTAPQYDMAAHLERYLERPEAPNLYYLEDYR